VIFLYCIPQEVSSLRSNADNIHGTIPDYEMPAMVELHHRIDWKEKAKTGIKSTCRQRAAFRKKVPQFEIISLPRTAGKQKTQGI
jgi:hypothetical protein